MTKLYTKECLYKDVYTIIEMMDSEMREKINKKFIDFLKENQNQEFVGTINRKIPIKDQELREDIKIMLSLIYINYFCTEEKKKEIMIIEDNNINDFYNRDIFEKRKENLLKQETEVKEDTTTLALVEYKDNFFKQIFRKIRKILFKK